MTIIEAIKSGRAFKRKSDKRKAAWIIARPHRLYTNEIQCCWERTDLPVTFETTDILADDWIVREE